MAPNVLTVCTVVTLIAALAMFATAVGFMMFVITKVVIQMAIEHERRKRAMISRTIGSMPDRKEE